MKIPFADVDNKQPCDFKIHREHGLQDYLFVHFKSPAFVMVDGEYVEVNKGMCIFFDKNKIQSYFPLENHEFLHDFMHFDLETDYEELVFDDIPKGKIINILIPDIISNALSAIKNEMAIHSEYKDDILTNLGMVFMYKIKNVLNLAHSNISKRSHFKNLYSLRMEIYQNPQTDWSIDNMCKKVCMSDSYFKHLYKEFFGVSCINDIICARIQAAKALLINSNFRISEIAEKCGYKNTEHFIRQFKKHTGISPNKFRNV